MSRGPDPFEQAIKDVVERTRLYFEPYLADIRLSKQAIMEQDTDQLQLSLTMLDTLISHPEQFGLFRVKFAGEAGVIVPKDRNEAQFEIGILPLLLSRKQLVLERLRELKGGHPARVETLVDLVEQVPDEASREALRSELSAMQQQITDLAAQAVDLGRQAEAASKQEFEELKKRIAGDRVGIFLVHGHDNALKFEVARFLERATDEEVTILAEAPNRGRTVIEKLSSILTSSSLLFS